jgi:hypothetical protein
MRDDLVLSATSQRAPRRYAGVAPLPAFDFDSLPDGVWLSTIEVAAVLRRAKGTLEMWRQKPAHPLRWTRVDGKPLYKACWVREFIAARQK